MMIRVINLKKSIDNTFWPVVVIVIIYIKNLRPKQALEGSISSAQMQKKDLLNKKLPNIQHLCEPSSIVYKFLYEEKYIRKSIK